MSENKSTILPRVIILSWSSIFVQKELKRSKRIKIINIST